jgi:hypothetical protein
VHKVTGMGLGDRASCVADRSAVAGFLAGMYNGDGAIDGVRATCLVAEAESLVHFLSHSTALLVDSVIAFS